MKNITPLNFIQKILNREDISCYYQNDLYKTALSKCENIEGLYLEFGLFVGNTAKQISEFIPKNKYLYGFESFGGMENDTTPEALKGINQLCGELPKYPENIKVIVGRIENSLPQFLRWHNENITFLNIDVAYNSVKYGLITLGEDKRLKAGTIIVLCHAIKELNEKIYDNNFKSFLSFVERFNVQYEYIGFGDVHIALKITKDI